MAIAQNKEQLRSAVQILRQEAKSIALVPTMGALHAGHISLIEIAKSSADAVIASIFVNPAQFGPSEDYSRYPRTMEEDCALLREAGAALVYTPDISDIYPEGFSTRIHVSDLTDGLCGAFRPGHFDGVATVVCKLLLRVLPDVAVFGEKDYQQLAVIRRMVTDLDIPVRIIGAATMREADGLALSSRNRYLTPAQRETAALLYATLRETADFLHAHPYNVDNAVSLAAYNLSHHGFTKVDYVALVEEANLTPLKVLNRPARLLAAAWLGNTRLIDGIRVIPPFG